jgi:hypothetical protein
MIDVIFEILHDTKHLGDSWPWIRKSVLYTMLLEAAVNRGRVVHPRLDVCLALEGYVFGRDENGWYVMRIVQELKELERRIEFLTEERSAA